MRSNSTFGIIQTIIFVVFCSSVALIVKSCAEQPLPQCSPNVISVPPTAPDTDEDDEYVDPHTPFPINTVRSRVDI